MEFKTYDLQDVSNSIYSGGTPNTKINKYWNGKYLWMSSGEPKYNFVYNTEKTITEDGVKNSSTKLAKKGSIVIASAGQGHARGQVSMCMRDMYINQSLICIDCNDKLINNYYLFYFLKNNYQYLRNISDSHSIRGSLTTNIIKKLKVKLCSLENQIKIVKILKKLDKKIELNNKINDNLYEVGIELLKNDFILENGMETLSQVIKFVKGKKPNDIITNKRVGYEKYLTIACLNGQELNYADTNKMIMSDNDLLMVMDGASSGEVYYGGQGIVGSTLSRIDCIDNNYISEFIFFSLKYYKDLIQSKNTGSAIPHTDKVFVGSLKIPKLSIEKQEKYKVLLTKIQHNENENKTLEQLRDTLLPKLMNGEIDLENISI